MKIWLHIFSTGHIDTFQMLCLTLTLDQTFKAALAVILYLFFLLSKTYICEKQKIYIYFQESFSSGTQ